MGANIYFSDKELAAMRESCSEWCDIMNDGDKESCECANDRLKDGLGSALKKLYKGRFGEDVYKDY